MAKIVRQTARQWIVTHEWMVNPMQQTEWIEGQGLLIWLAEVFSSLGTGLYIVSLFVTNGPHSLGWWGALVGWLIVVGLKLPLHFFYLGKPWRFWRAMPPFTKAWRTSWIARGTFFSVVFAGLGVCQLASSWFIPGSAIDILAKVVAGFFCLLTGIYCGFAMSYCKSLPFWNTGLLPIVITNAGIADGLGLVDWRGDDCGRRRYSHLLENVTRVLLLANVLLISTYIMNGSYRSTTGWFFVPATHDRPRSPALLGRHHIAGHRRTHGDISPDTLGRRRDNQRVDDCRRRRAYLRRFWVEVLHFEGWISTNRFCLRQSIWERHV